MRNRFRAAVTVALTAALAVAGLAGCDLSDLRGQDGEDSTGGETGGGQTWERELALVDGVEVFDRESLDREHAAGPISYDAQPPVGGQHNDFWQDCTGVVYDAPIADEHAVHSLEHGAVWVTYHPSLPADQVETLAGLVTGVDYTMLSPYEDLDSPISLQAWGYQLRADEADDRRIEEFIRVLRVNATMEPGATCGGPNAVTTTGTTPVDSPG